MHSMDDFLVCLGDINGHKNWHLYGFGGVRGGYGAGRRIIERRMFLEFCLVMVLCVSNNWFKRYDNWKASF